MGSPRGEEGRDSDEDQQQVCINYDFYISSTEVTFKAYDQFARETLRRIPGDEGWGRGNRPVMNINWYEAIAFAKGLSQKTRHTYRLPTEAEWEFAARAGTTTPYWWGLTISCEQVPYGLHKRSYYECGRNGKTIPVKTSAMSPWGLYEVHGNVWEWTCSNYTEDFNGVEQVCAPEQDIARKALKGGSWKDNGSDSRAANRGKNDPFDISTNGGFRLIRID